MEGPTIFHTFEDYLKENYKNEKTIRGYRIDIESFLLYLDREDVKIAEVREKHIRSYIMELKENGVSNSTINRKNSALRQYFKYLRKQGIMLINPYDDIPQLEIERKTTTIKAEDIERMKEYIQNGNDLRIRLMLSFSLNEKLKLSEMIKLRKEDIHLYQGIVYAGKKAVPVSEETRKLIEERLKDEDGEFILSSYHGNPLTESGSYFILKNYLKEIDREEIRPIDLIK